MFTCLVTVFEGWAVKRIERDSHFVAAATCNVALAVIVVVTLAFMNEPTFP
jgi:hypothetical protein